MIAQAGLTEREAESLEREARGMIRDDADIGYGGPRNPLGAIVARICEALGLEPDWDRLCEHDWARTEIASGPPESSPFSTWLAARSPPPHAASP